jgi:hypothetical protein
MQHLEGSDTPVLYIGRTVLKGQSVLVLVCLMIYDVLLVNILNYISMSMSRSALFW